MNKAPDLIVRWNLDRGYTYLSRSSLAFKGRFPIEKVSSREIWESKAMIAHAGSHRENGLFLFKGEGIKAGCEAGAATVLDMAPTLLYRLGFPIPKDMDGRVITGIFEGGYLERYPILYADPVESVKDFGKEEAFSDEEMAKVSERLKGLGYLD
ncbi:MAG: hypothetical protein HZA19_00395 [Nitrospirae bacterium]|nr:hypothetical protein [Nitrospirota bacterium]